MLAHAFLAVATATERDYQPTPIGPDERTVNEFHHLSLMLCSSSLALPTTPLLGPGYDGDDNTNTDSMYTHYKRRQHQ